MPQCGKLFIWVHPYHLPVPLRPLRGLSLYTFNYLSNKPFIIITTIIILIILLLSKFSARDAPPPPPAGCVASAPDPSPAPRH